MSAMKVGVLLCAVLAAACVAADSGAASPRHLVIRPVGIAACFGPVPNSHSDSAIARDVRGRIGFANPFLYRCLPVAGSGPLTYAQWRSGRYVEDAFNGNRSYYGRPAEQSVKWYSYDSPTMKTAGLIGYFVVPFLVPASTQEALKRTQDSSPPAGHGWPYDRW